MGRDITVMRMYALWAAVSYPRDVCNAIDAGSNADDSAPHASDTYAVSGG